MPEKTVDLFFTKFYSILFKHFFYKVVNILLNVYLKYLYLTILKI